MIRLLLASVVCLQLAACSSATRWEEPASVVRVDRQPAHPKGQHAVQVAKSMIGTPYVYGGATPQGFDCSGLVHYSYRQAGVNVPRTSAAQYSATRKISLSEARAGDLVFFRDGRRISHVGIYIGGDQFVHAPKRGSNVEIMSLDVPWYRSRFAGVGRPD